MTPAADSVLSCSTAQERGTYAILAAIKPNEANDAVLGWRNGSPSKSVRSCRSSASSRTHRLISSFAAGVPVIPPFHDEEERRAIKRALRAGYERTGHRVSRLRVDVLEGSAPVTSRTSRGSTKSAWWWWERGRAEC